MHRFLSLHRDELIDRCKAKVALRPQRAATGQQLANGVPIFLDQLTRTLAAEDSNERALGEQISGPAGGDALALSEIGLSATQHGKALLDLGYTVDQVVHDYGDLCQAITDLAFEHDAPFAVDEFRTLNRCLDNAIADAVTAFSEQREARIERDQMECEKQRVGFLVHELRNSLGTATLAVRALELSHMGMGGATGAVLKRSLSMLGMQLGRAITEVSPASAQARETFSLAAFIAEAGVAGRLDAHLSGCTFEVRAVDASLALNANRELLHAALANLLQNAFKFTQVNGAVRLMAYAADDRILIDVADHCGGLAPGSVAKMFIPFQSSGGRKAGLGLGLSIARQSIEADQGTLSVRDVPGTGCVFTINLPRHALESTD
ncbi:sensor histidine kinase [Hydrogenophaga sp.]